MIKTYKRRIALLLALLICCTVVFDAPLRSITVYADDHDEYEDDFYDDEFEDDDYYEDEDEPDEAPPPPPPPPSYNDVEAQYKPKIDNINDQLSELAAQKTQVEREIANARTDKEKEQANKVYIDSQIAITQSEIELLHEKIELKEEEIEQKIVHINHKQAEYNRNYALYLRRLQNMQLNGEASQLAAVFGADSFADYLATNALMGRIADYDQRLMTRVRRERIELEEERTALEDDHVQLEDARQETEDKRKTLAVQQQSAMLKIQDLKEMETQFLKDLEKNVQMQKAMEAELERIHKEIELSKNPYVGGQMEWPVPGYYNITSRYGWRFGNRDFHTGMDISGSGVHGKPIVAANDGTIAHINTRFTPGVGYGIFLIIDHGGKVTTLYAHCSKILVSVGQQVKRGDVIAYIGSTGWSTGPHLHFEIREDGKHKNPEGYLRGR